MLVMQESRHLFAQGFVALGVIPRRAHMDVGNDYDPR
jgi:hypothetical protein